jgi:hypothetical protein
MKTMPLTIIKMTGHHDVYIHNMEHNETNIKGLITDPENALAGIWQHIPKYDPIEVAKYGGSRPPKGTPAGQRINHVAVNFYYDVENPNPNGGIRVTGVKGLPVVNVLVPTPKPQGGVRGNILHREWMGANNIHKFTGALTNDILFASEIDVSSGNSTQIPFDKYEITTNQVDIALYDKGIANGSCAIHVDMAADPTIPGATWYGNIAKMLCNPSSFAAQLNAIGNYVEYDIAGNPVNVTNDYVFRSDINGKQFKATVLLPSDALYLKCAEECEEVTCIKTQSEFNTVSGGKKQLTLSGVVVYRWCAC